MNRREFVAGLTVSTALVSTSRGQSNVVRVGYSIGQTGPLASSTPVQSQAYTLWATGERAWWSGNRRRGTQKDRVRRL